MSNFVGDNPVIMSGTVVAFGREQVVIGDDRGNTLIFRWTDEEAAIEHGTPAALIVDLPAAGPGRQFSMFRVHSEGKHVQVRYSVEHVGENFHALSYTVLEDVGALLAESEAPGLAYHPGEAGRMSVGPD